MLLERDQELGLLADLLAGLESSGGKVVLIRGEAGIGKTALVKQFTDRHSDKAHIYFGSCDDFSIPQPLGPFWDIARQETSLVEPLRNDDRPGLLQACLDLLSRSLRPNILVIEDTQWADEATLDAIKYLGRRIERTNGLLVLTYRDGEVDYDHPLRAAIGAFSPQNLVRLHLDGLSQQAVETMVDKTELDVGELVDLTGGNPLFITEILASGVEEVPSSVQDSVLARASKLSLGARRLLDLVSVIPGEVERELIEEILTPEDDDAIECSRQGLIRAEDDTFSFHHELTRRAVESALSTHDRRRLNEEILAALTASGDHSRLLHHAKEAGDGEAIIEFGPKAARAAMATGSHREAVAHFRTLEPHLDRVADIDRAGIVEDWARSEFYLDNQGALDILDRAIDLHRAADDDLALARALTFAARVNEVNGRPETAEASSVEAVAILEAYPPSGDLAFAVSAQGWLSMMRGEDDRALDFAEQAIIIAEEVGDELTAVHSRNTKGTVTHGLGVPGGLEVLEEARSRAERGGYRFEEVRALGNMAGGFVDLRQLDRAVDSAQRTRDTADRYEMPVMEAFGKVSLAHALMLRGEWLAAGDLATDAVDSHPHIGLMAYWMLGTLQARRGRPEASQTLAQSWSLASVNGEIQHLAPSAAANAEHIWVTGHQDSVLIDQLRDALVKARGSLLNPWATGDLAFWLWKLGELSETPERIPDPYRLVMDGDPLAASEIWSKIGCPYERAIALAHGDETGKLEALDILDDLGATAVAAKLRKSLRDLGVSVPRGKGQATRDHAAGLTARQAEVLQLLDEGLSNTQISDRLFVSPRTVEHHVSAVLSKLDSSTREEAVENASQQGLLPTR